MMENFSGKSSTVLLVYCRLAILLSKAVQEGRFQIPISVFDDEEAGLGSLDRFMDLCAMADIGQEVELPEVRGLLESESPGESYFVIGISTAAVVEMSAGEILRGNELAKVGSVVFKASNPPWMFYRPLEFYSLGDRLLFFENWQVPWS